MKPFLSLVSLGLILGILSGCAGSPGDSDLGRYMLHHQGWNHGSTSYPPRQAPAGALSSDDARTGTGLRFGI